METRDAGRRGAWCALLALLLGGMVPVQATVERSQPAVGVIAAANGGPEIRFIATPAWQPAELEQSLLGGDTLRTGPFATLGLLFADRTQVRVQRNSVLTIKSVTTTPRENVLRLERGGTWSRATREEGAVRIETPSATAAIRGTDWALSVDEAGRTTLTVLDGRVALANPYGEVTVQRGEVGFAEIGKAPTKTILVNPRDHEQLIYNLSLPDALALLPLNDVSGRARLARRQALEAVAPAQRDAAQWLELGELAYDMGDHRTAQVALTAAPATGPRHSLLAGYLALLESDAAAAERHLAAAAAGLGGERRLLARIGHTAALLQVGRSTEAAALFRQMEADQAGQPRLEWFRVVLHAYAGDLPQAMALAEAGSARFPQDALFPGVEGVIAILLARPEAAAAAAERALARDPEVVLGFLVQGIHRTDYLRDTEGAVAVYRAGLAAHPYNANLWGQLGLAYASIGEARLAEEAYGRALALAPNDVPALCNHAILLLDQYRLDEAATVLARIERIEPGRDILLMREGRIAMQRGHIDAAVERFLRATTVNPALSEATLALAVGYYQNGEVALARQALDNAARLDPHDPDIPLVGSVIALDRSEADQAVDYAREAIRIFRQRGGTGVDALAATRGGNNNLGAAYANLGLDAWAAYYSELSFDPYAADSYMFRAVQAEDALPPLYQGLLLEPLATAAPNRFVQFFRHPFHDGEVGLSTGRSEGGVGSGMTVNLQGFAQEGLPFAYYLNGEQRRFTGDRPNSRVWQQTGSAFAGVNLTPYDRMLFDLNVTRSHTGVPGTVERPDGDDRMAASTAIAGVGYSHQFAARNVLLGRFSAHDARSAFRNDDPLGSTLTNLDYSLVDAFGLELTQLLYYFGLADATDPATPEAPRLLLGEWGLPTLPYTLGASLDTRPEARLDYADEGETFQLRHLFTRGAVDVSYGIEATRFRRDSRVAALALAPLGTGTLIGEGGTMEFPYGEAVMVSRQTLQSGLADRTHLNALWRVDNRLWWEGGVFWSRFDDGLDDAVSRWEPRLGLAWQPGAQDWLRLMARQDTGLPFTATLAPTATVGLTAPAGFLDTGGQSTLYVARWDREWTRRLFSTFQLSRRDIDGFQTSAPGGLDIFQIGEGRIDQASLALNVWLGGGVGLHAQYAVNASENLEAGAHQGARLPLVPEEEIKAGITWVHPSRLRVALLARAVGARGADAADTDELAGYTTADLNVSWQSRDKRVQWGLLVSNLTDRRYAQGADLPGARRYLELNALLRF